MVNYMPQRGTDAKLFYHEIHRRWIIQAQLQPNGADTECGFPILFRFQRVRVHPETAPCHSEPIDGLRIKFVKNLVRSNKNQGILCRCPPENDTLLRDIIGWAVVNGFTDRMPLWNRHIFSR